MTAHGEATVDDLLREASDPTIGAERHTALWLAVQRGEGTSAVARALLRNPAASPERLLRWLRDYSEAWENPLTVTLLWADPSIAEVAARVLHLEASGLSLPEPVPTAGVRDQVAMLARWQPMDEDGRSVRAFARHLASLLGLPWPEETP